MVVVKLYVSGFVPKILLVAQAHSVSPVTIIKRVVARRAKRAKQFLMAVFPIDKVMLTPSAAAAVLQFRTSPRRAPPANAPAALLPVLTGETAELEIIDVFPRTTCFVQVDLETFAIRWSTKHFLGLVTVRDVNTIRRGSMSLVSSVRLEITYSHHGGVLHKLFLRLPIEQRKVWSEGLKTLSAVARRGSSAHWRWALSCMTASSHRGATGSLPRSELQKLLRCANASAALASDSVEEALRSVIESLERSHLPKWVRQAVSAQSKLLNVQQLGVLLQHLSTSSADIKDLHERYATSDLMTLAEFLQFVGAEQGGSLFRDTGELNSATEQSLLDENELAIAQRRFRRTAPAPVPGVLSFDNGGFSPIHFASALLCPSNKAAMADDSPDLTRPIAHYWTAASHNSYIVGDQLTGVSTADAYRRQLLQDTRNLEIDCWDGGARETNRDARQHFLHGGGVSQRRRRYIRVRLCHLEAAGDVLA